MTSQSTRNRFHKILPDCIVILIFIALSFIYFFPAVIEGRILFQHDTSAGIGAGQEAVEYKEETNKTTRWTNALFGGMPTYQISPSYHSTEALKVVEQIYSLSLPEYVWLTFIMMLGFYILLRSIGLSPWLSGLGGIIWAFSSYFFILISAGHIWKFITLAYIPPTIAGIVLAYRKKYLLGAVLTALFVALQIKSNHIQMSYYFFFVILCLVIAYFVETWKNKELPHFLKASALLIIAGSIGVLTNVSNLYHTYQYSKETMRGKSELVESGEKQASNGLERSYITQWSYGIGETLTLLVPNIKGGASVPLAQNEKAMAKGNPMYTNIYQQLTQYFGAQPMTAGPVYVGAFVFFLFILGCFIVKGPIKWGLLIATLLSILLSWGKNLMPLTDFFIDYIPLYNKFRAVSSILVIAEFTIPLLAILALYNLLKDRLTLGQYKKELYISLGLTAGLALLLAIVPTLFFSQYNSPEELKALQQIPNEHLVPLLDSLKEMRLYLLTSDAWRSLGIILMGTLFLFLFHKNKMNKKAVILAITVLCLVDLWSINKRYLNDSQFVDSSAQTTTFKKTETDQLILQDPDINYRVLNLASNTFNENNTSYWHKSIGGYHAAKLRRYQELIEHHIVPEIQHFYQDFSKNNQDIQQIDEQGISVLNMLNTKYIILPVEGGKTFPLQNPHTYGNAWFVDNVTYVQTANEEIEQLQHINPKETAIVNEEFKSRIKNFNQSTKDSLAHIELLEYEPNYLKYKVSTTKENLALFSEIYYPQWSATLNGVPIEIGRANYVLRAITIPEGEHILEMNFNPNSIKQTEVIAYIALTLLLAGFLLLIVKKAIPIIKRDK